MRRDELCPKLKAVYSKEAGCGVEKVDDPNYANIWFVVPPAPPRIVPKKMPVAAMSKANHVLNSLPSFDQMTDLDKLVNFLFIRREALQSSRLEGTWSTMDHLLTPKELYDENETSSSHQSVRNYAAVLEKYFQAAFEKKEKIFTNELVCSIHKSIVAKDPSFKGQPGVLRAPGQTKSVVFIGGFRKEDSTYNPTPPKRVKSSLAEVMDWLSDIGLAEVGDAGLGFSLPLRLAIAHSHFEAVHPFSDGNGRVGRALWPLQMVCAGHVPLYLSGYVEKERETYSYVLQEAQKKLNYAPLVEFICSAVLESSEESKKIIKIIKDLPLKWKSQARFRANSTSEKALEVLLTNPVITVSLLVKKLKVSKQAANTAIQQLVERKIITERSSVGKTRVFAAEELISVLSRS